MHGPIKPRSHSFLLFCTHPPFGPQTIAVVLAVAPRQDRQPGYRRKDLMLPLGTEKLQDGEVNLSRRYAGTPDTGVGQ